MLKKIVYSIVAGSLVFAAQVASADDTQFWIGDRYQGVSALPFTTVDRGIEAPKAAPQVKRVMPRESATRLASVPAPYNTDAGYFN